jgi:hypothetical protein
MRCHDGVGHALLNPAHLWCTKDLRIGRGMIPRRAGIYAWFAAKHAVPLIAGASGWSFADWTLIYVGKAVKSGGLSRRLRAHFKRDAGHSNFRLHIGVALGEVLNLKLLHKNHPDYDRVGENILNGWLDENCRVAWLEVDDPQASITESALIRSHNPPLNAESPWFSEHLSLNERQLVESCGTRTRSWLRWSAPRI